MQQLAEAAESIARETSENSGLDDRPNADPMLIAVSYLGLRLVPRQMRGARLVNDWIMYPRSADEQHAAYAVSHEIGHWLAREANLRLSRAREEVVASRIGCALILPRRSFLRDVRNVGGDVTSLLVLWPLATERIVRRRLDELAA
jgi:hypothetical protein